MKMELFNLTIDIHLNDPMNNEAKIKLLNLKTKELTEFDIENVGQLEDGSLNFVFSIINQPHQFILNQTKKTITWFSEWGHWQTNYFYK
jgi:5-methylthioribose kinase